VAILFNPSAGGGKALKKKSRLEYLLRRWEVPADLMVTADEEHLRALTRECAGRYRVLAGAGGDSTFQIIINEILRSRADVDFGLIALGSSNDVAREFGIQGLEKACRALKRRRNRTIDLGSIEHEGAALGYFIGQANIGLGAKVNRYVAELARKRPGLASLQALAGILGVISAYRRKAVPLSLTVRGGEKESSGDYAAAVISNIRFWASGRLLNPSARTDDGRLDGCLIAACPLFRLARLASLARKGRHVGAPEVEFLAGPAIEVSSERAFEVQADGEIIGGGETPRLFRDVRFRVVPRALRLIC
jgi:diacylglycerol kinase (ATP)